MDEQEKRTYLEKYQEAKKKGVPFFPDILFKDAIVSLVVFIVLIALAYFVGAPLEARANPADTAYTPRPEWYFLFMFQLLKYFPGKLEVIGVIVLPTLAILLLFFLPLLDRSPHRHFLKRPVITTVATLAVVGIAFLTIQAVRETPPPAEATSGDQTAALYAANCAPCHGASITVPPGTNLHQVIAQGKHEGMPAWGADLSTDQIDALAGFILSPGGSQLFTQYCSECHQAPELVASNPLELKRSLDESLNYPPHANAKISDWSTVMSSEGRSRLLNFLVAPDGERLFATNCSPCHGSAVAYSGGEEELRSIIAKGGLHLEMPPWRTKLSQAEIDTLASYVVNPESEPSGKKLFDQYCKTCHGERIPTATSVEQARTIIATGGPHQTMPIWGDILTSEQLEALVQYALQAAQGTSLATGQQLFATNCAPCHGEFGEGGPNPSQPSYLIPPISSSEFLKTRDDTTLQAIIAQGQPDLGMTPFGTAYGGPLEDTDIDAIVAYMRSWEANPPAALPPQPPASGGTPTPGAQSSTPSSSPSFAADVMPILQAKCVLCHGSLGGWNATSYTSVMTSGDHTPVVIPGDAANSLLAQKLLGTQTMGGIMPPSGKLSDSEIQIIINWINAGALEK